MMDAVVFLDRDGVLNRRIVDDYVTCLEEFELLPGVPESLARLTEHGFRLAVVTNQRGIAVGRMSRKAVDEVHAFLKRKVTRAGGLLEEFYVCPHDRDEGCPCRKPKPGLLDLANELSPVDWSRSFLIGDSDSDIQAGLARSVTTIKVAGPSRVGADYECSDLGEAVSLILEICSG